MIFTRSVPNKTVSQYSGYREQIRADFQNRCAYCFRHEFHFGGEKNGNIDHFRPAERFPQLKTDFQNLYWSCRECNELKWDFWPTASQLAKGMRFIDSASEEADSHLWFKDDGHVTPFTRAGFYTNKIIVLDRDELVAHRRMIKEITKEIPVLQKLLKDPDLPEESRERGAKRLSDCLRILNPPVYNAPRRSKKALLAEVDAFEASL